MPHRFLARRLDREPYLGVSLTLGILTSAALVWAFGGLLEEVLDAEGLVQWDRAVVAWFHAHATPGGLRAFDAITQLGSPVVWALIPLVAAVLWWRGAHFLFWLWLSANLGGKVVEWILKHEVHRTRPEYAAAFLNGHSYSFPSGHAMGATVGYLVLAYIAAVWHRRRHAGEADTRVSASLSARASYYAAATAVILAVGLSRLYLGVHYPSDVLGGYLAGTAWVALCLTVAGIAHRQHRARLRDAVLDRG